MYRRGPHEKGLHGAPLTTTLFKGGGNVSGVDTVEVSLQGEIY